VREGLHACSSVMVCVRACSCTHMYSRAWGGCLRLCLCAPYVLARERSSSIRRAAIDAGGHTTDTMQQATFHRQHPTQRSNGVARSAGGRLSTMHPGKATPRWSRCYWHTVPTCTRRTTTTGTRLVCSAALPVWHGVQHGLRSPSLVHLSSAQHCGGTLSTGACASSCER
jgi:hypothetical protein